MTNTSKEKKIIYVPVTTTPGDSKIKYPDNPAGKKCCWWSDNSLLSYNAMLVSADSGMGQIKDRSEIRDDVLFLGDSGGYQIYKDKMGKLKDRNKLKKLTWKEVIKWQMSVCDIGMTLDIPTPREWIDINDRNIFKERMDESRSNALNMLKYKEEHINDETTYNKNFKLFNCVHGVYLDQIEEWYRETTDNGKADFDGFAFSTSKSMKYVLALKLGFAMEYCKGKPLHIFGTSSPSSIALISYANRYTDTQIYFDSSNASYGRQIRKYMLFWNLSGEGVEFKEKNRKYKKYYSLECPCPICSKLERPDDLWELGTTSGILITLHNTYWLANYTSFINNLAHYKDEFKAFVKYLTNVPSDNPYQPPENIEEYVASAGSEMTTKSGGSSWVLRSMRFLDNVHEDNLATAWDKFFKKHEPNDFFDYDEDDPENENFYADKADYNSKTRNALKEAIFESDKIIKEMEQRDIRNQNTQEEVKIEELVEEDLAKVSSSSLKSKSKQKNKTVRRAPIDNSEF